MNRRNIIIFLGVAVVLFVVGYFFSQHNRSKSSPGVTSISTTNKPVVNPSTVPSVTSGPSTSPTRTPSTTQVKFYLVAVGDEGKSGMKIGCGDSLVPVTQKVTSTKGVLQASLTELLSLKQKNYGESGLYNSLYQSNLTLVSAVIKNGVAVVHISGTVQLGGVCDDPRFVEQIRQTVLQFPNIHSADIYINDRTLESYGSEK